MNNSIVKFSINENISNNILTSDVKIKNTKVYKDVTNILFRLVENGLVSAGSGYCISMADIIYSLLIQNKIPCKLVECQLTATNKENNNTTLIGFKDFKSDESQVDSHVVVVTSTEPSLIIDFSILHILPKGIYGIIDAVSSGEDRIISNIESENMALIYQEKKSVKIPMLHQRSIIDRINTDINIYKNLGALRLLIILALIISTLNAFRGAYEYYTVFIDKENLWGPSVISEILHRLDNIEKSVSTEKENI